MNGRRAPLLGLLLAASGCSHVLYESHFAAPAQLERITEAASRAPFLKCHMPDGRVFVLEQWSIEEGSGTVEGFGIEYDAERTAQPAKRHTLNLNEIAVLETDRPYNTEVGAASVLTLAVGTGVSVAVSIGCLASLKKAPCWK